MPIKTKSISDPREPADGLRLFVSSYLPKAGYPDMDLWFPELGSPLELIINWGSERHDWEKFSINYLEQLQLEEISSLLAIIKEQAKITTITLLGHARNDDKCHRYILQQYLETFK